MKNKKILLTIMLTVIALCVMPTLSNAALQTTRGTGSSKKDYATNWVIRVRQMEAQGGGMGLNEVINETTGEATTSSNGIDVHMQKNTEYGAAILLGASDYGKQGSLSTDAQYSRYMNKGYYISDMKSSEVYRTHQMSTTGNITGIYELGNGDWEWTAGGGKEFLSNIAPKYRNIYEAVEGKAGDATIENGVNLGTSWHGSSSGGFATGSYGFLRGSSSYGVFSFYSSSASADYYARACVVSAPGL